VVRIRKTHLYSLWLILIIVLFFANWIGLRERYLTNNYVTSEVIQVAVGEFDIYSPGQEMAYLTSSAVYVISDLDSVPIENVTYTNFAWETNPLLTMSVGDFDSQQKGDEISVLLEDGTLILIHRTAFSWSTEIIGSLPNAPPVWITNAMVSGQLIQSSKPEEIAFVGEFFNWTSSTITGRVFVASRFDNGTWSINEVYIDANQLLCATIGDLEFRAEGEEILVAGDGTGVILVSYNNGTWDSTQIYSSFETIKSIAIGEIMPFVPGYEVAFVRGRDVITLFKERGEWVPRQIWNSDNMQAGINTVQIGDIDPYNPGQEVLAEGYVYEDNRSILIVLKFKTDDWESQILWNLVQMPQEVLAHNLNFNREGFEIIVANGPYTAVLAMPNLVDRTLRAFQMVILPAIILLPAAILVFAVAEYIGRATEQRRHRYTLEMVSKGFVKCPYCKRFIPKDKMEAHLRWHRKAQFR
jgi:hypothetical protein